MAQREQVLDRAQRLQQAFVNGTLRSTWLSLVSRAPRGARLLLQIRTKCYTTIRSRRFGNGTLRCGVLLHHALLLSVLPFAGSLCSGYSHLERQLFTSRVHLQHVALLDVPSQEFLGQRILEVFPHSTAHRSSAVDWIVALIDQKLDCGRIQVNLDILGAYPLDDFCHLEIHNLDQVVSARAGGRRSLSGFRASGGI